MNIGLVRHFKVNCYTKMFMTSDDFKQWVKQYDNSDIIENKFEIGNIIWHKCFSSDLSRATKTSKSIFTGEIIKTQLLREVPIAPIFNTNIKLPYVFWCISGRIAWFFQHKSQIENKKDTQRRVNEFLDSIKNESNNNILIVCHGLFMNTLQKGLKSRGVSGQNIKRHKNGTLYLYKK
ncbi:phosphoglycerate mutase family protein [Clostridium estertheticum]|uniref:phosphoglycerate mutase family protein n=1 Tax=Clostridium estertheticum TaxID=238834 RepID=UPI0013E92EEB|nr:histidine phosphatase family protein [Clostridium estertheticum]MBZ9687372.1 phosphoglycerate mutase family protein [Clostridium estertheticum]